MQFVTFQSISYALWLYPPNWDAPPTVTLRAVSSVEDSLTRKESRRQLAVTMRYQLECESLLTTTQQCEEAREGLLRLKGDLVGVPLWTDGSISTATINSGATTITIDPTTQPARVSKLGVIIDDSGAFELVAISGISGSTITLSAATASTHPVGSIVYPLLCGHFDPRPAVVIETDQMSTFSLTLVEDSDAAHAVTPFPSTLATVGASIPAHSAETLWDVRPDYANIKEDTEADVTFDEIGFSRLTEKTVYIQQPRRLLTFDFLEGTRANIARVERLYWAAGGQVDTFWVPSFRTDLTLISNLPITGNTKEMEVATTRYSDASFNAHPGKPYLVLDDSSRLLPVLVDTIAGGPPVTLTLDQVVSTTWTASQTKVSSLVLSRFADDNLAWKYETDFVATATVKFVEVTEEYASAPNAQIDPIYLYRITEQTQRSPTVYRYTSYESDIAWTDGTYTSAAWSHSEIKDSLDPSSDTCTITTGRFTGHPFLRIMPYTLEGRMQVEIIESRFSNHAIALPLFTGELVELRPEGNKMTATCKKEPSIFNRKIPTVQYQYSCNWTLFSPPCALIKSTLAKFGTVSLVSGQQVNVTFGAPFAAQYFAGGSIETGAGAFQQRSVTYSAANVGSVVAFSINRPFTTLTVGDQVICYPGCDGSYETCRDKFGNLINFGGMKFAPAVNPSLPQKAVPAQGGGKGGGK